MSRAALVFERQWLHAGALAVLLLGFQRLSGLDAVRAGSLWGVSSLEWAWAAIGLAVAHQLLVWFCWRTELHLGWLSGLLGSAGFVSYAVLFSILGIARTAAVWILAIANRGTLDAPEAWTRPLAVLLALPTVYLFYSVKRYFGFRRAFGADHFDPRYRGGPLVREGIFRYTRNGMYFCGLLILWLPGLWWTSAAALWVALFNHLYIWVHYFATELPDMRRIYGPAVDGARGAETETTGG